MKNACKECKHITVNKVGSCKTTLVFGCDKTSYGNHVSFPFRRTACKKFVKREKPLKFSFFFRVKKFLCN